MHTSQREVINQIYIQCDHLVYCEVLSLAESKVMQTDRIDRRLECLKVLPFSVCHSVHGVVSSFHSRKKGCKE